MKALLKWTVLAPPVTAGAVMWSMTLASLPITAAGVGACAFIALVIYLGSGHGERISVQILMGATLASPAEAALLEPVRTLLQLNGLTSGDIFVQRRAGHRNTAEPVGRSSIVLSREVLERVLARRAEDETVAVLLAHADARRHASGGMRHDIACRVVALPWGMARRAASRLGRAFGWIPGLGLFRFIAAIVVAAEVCRTAAAGLWWIAVVLACSASSLVGGPIVRRQWAAGITRAADDSVALGGLREPLIRLLAASNARDAIERIHRLAPASGERIRHLHLVRAPEEPPRGIHSVAIHPQRSMQLQAVMIRTRAKPPSSY